MRARPWRANKERTHQKSVSKNETEPVEYIPRKFFCQLIYRELEKVKGLTQDQYETAVKKYPLTIIPVSLHFIF